MIVVAIIGIIGSVALPQYLKARSLAKAAVQVNTAISFAMECRTLAISKIGPVAQPDTNITVNCGIDGGTVTTVFDPGVTGIRCIQAVSTDSQLTATVTISSQGVVSCAYS